MTDTIIKHSSQFLLEARQLKHFLKPIVSCLTRQADALEYSIWRVKDHQRKLPSHYWDTMEIMATNRGWRVTRVYNDKELELVLFSAAVCNNLAIHPKLWAHDEFWVNSALSVEEQERLSLALLAQGFNLTDKDENTLIYANTNQATFIPHDRNCRTLTENPFPEAQTFLKSERAKTSCLRHFAKLIEEQGEEYGYVVEFFNNRGNDQLAQIEPTLQKAGWLVTKVMEGADLDFVLLSPVGVLQLDIRTAYYSNLVLKEDKQDRLIEALKLQNYRLTERDAHYLSFSLSRSTRS